MINAGAGLSSSLRSSGLAPAPFIYQPRKEEPNARIDLLTDRERGSPVNLQSQSGRLKAMGQAAKPVRGRGAYRARVFVVGRLLPP